MQPFQFFEFLSITYINVPVLASFPTVKSCQYCKNTSVLVCYNNLWFILNYWHVPGSWLALADL